MFGGEKYNKLRFLIFLILCDHHQKSKDGFNRLLRGIYWGR